MRLRLLRHFIDGADLIGAVLQAFLWRVWWRWQSASWRGSVIMCESVSAGRGMPSWWSLSRSITCRQPLMASAPSGLVMCYFTNFIKIMLLKNDFVTGLSTALRSYQVSSHHNECYIETMLLNNIILICNATIALNTRSKKIMSSL